MPNFLNLYFLMKKNDFSLKQKSAPESLTGTISTPLVIKLMPQLKRLVANFVFFIISKNFSSRNAVESSFGRYSQASINKFFQQFKLFKRRRKQFFFMAFLILGILFFISSTFLTAQSNSAISTDHRVCVCANVPMAVTEKM